MTARLGGLIVIGLLAGGCTTLPPAGAPDQLQLHVEGAGQLVPWKHRGFIGAADVALGHTGCCDAGIYVAAASLDNGYARAHRTTEVLQGGLQLGVALPVWEDRFRLRARIGKAGTPPAPPLFGRSGFSTSAVVLFRVWDIEPPQTNEFKPNIDLMLGLTTLSMQAENSSAGSLRDLGENDLIKAPNAASAAALLLGIRIGTDYGIDLE
jgi:hypothetical protein